MNDIARHVEILKRLDTMQITTQRDAYLSFACGYLWGTLNQLRSSYKLDKKDDQILSEAVEFIQPILAKLYEKEEVQPNRFLLFTDQQLESLLSAIFSNERIWRHLIKTELARRQELPVPSNQFSSIPAE